MDAILETGRYPDSVIGIADQAFWDRLTHGIDTLVMKDNYGDLETRASLAPGLAQKLRSDGELSFSRDFTAHLIEAEILYKFKGDDLYGTDGVTVQDRLDEMKQLEADKGYFRKFKKYSDLVSSPDVDPKLKAQFFMRMRADGELAAVNWLMGQRRAE